MSWTTYLTLLAVCSFVQSIVFTWASRSRNSGDPSYHRIAATASNAVWFGTNLFVLKVAWEPLLAGDWVSVLVTALVCVLATTEGSVLAMRVLIRREHGKRRVGAR